MGLGRRSAPSAPPIPTRPLPPSAYGIGVPGAPVAPGQQFAPPPPPSAPPAAAPSPFADFAPPAPATQYSSTAPASPTNPFGAPPVAYGTPTGLTPPAKKRGTRTWAKVLGAVIAAFMALGWFVRLHDVATMHHLASAMPATLADAGQLTGPQVDTMVSQIEAKESTDYARFKNLHVAVYTTGSSRVFAMVGELPSGGQRHTDEFFQGMADGAGTAAQPLHSVPAGPKGGGMKCASLTAGGTVCAWVDNGTTGVVAANADESGTLVYINALRVAMER